VSDRVATTPDLSIAAFWHMRGLEVLSAVKLDRRRYRFAFADPQGKAEGLRIEFANSESARFDSSQRAMKKLTRPLGPGEKDRARD